MVKKLPDKSLHRIRTEINHIGCQTHNQQIMQRQISLYYQMLMNNKEKLPRFQDVGFRVYSQADEDGLLLYIFSLIGFTNKVLVDIASGVPYGANSTNLICNLGFSGLLIEGSADNVEATKQFYASHPDTCLFPPKQECLWVTAENINGVFSDNFITGEIDLFSLDVDGVDYWLWEKLSVVQPRVVIAEAATFWGKEKSVTIPYNPKFNRFDIHPDYMGASIPAFIKLGRKKGYRLVACNRYGYNLIFVSDDIGSDVLPEISVDECFYFLPLDLKQKREERLKSIISYEWIEV
jgi:hypothetical protein